MASAFCIALRKWCCEPAPPKAPPRDPFDDQDERQTDCVDIEYSGRETVRRPSPWDRFESQRKTEKSNKEKKEEKIGGK